MPLFINLWIGQIRITWLLKTATYICMNVSFTLLLVCNRNYFMVGPIRIMWRKQPRTTMGIPLMMSMY